MLVDAANAEPYLALGGRESNFTGLGIAISESQRAQKLSAISKPLKLQERGSVSCTDMPEVGCVPTYPRSCKN
jgi:hypothetical protein